MKSMKFWLRVISLGVLVSASLILANPMTPELYGHHKPSHGGGGGGGGGGSCNPGGGGFSYNYRCIGQELVNFLGLETPRDISCALSVEIDIDRINDPIISQVTTCDNELRFVSNSDLDLTITKIDETVPSTEQSQAVLDALGLFIDRSDSNCDFYNPAGRRINRNPQVSLNKVLRDSPGNDLWFDPRGPSTQTLLLMNKPGRAGVFDCTFKLDFFLDPLQVEAIAAGEYQFRMNFLSSADSDEGCNENFDDPEAICENDNEAPDANDDFASTTMNTGIVVDVLENDYDIFDQDDLYIIEPPQMLNPDAGSVICDIDVPKSAGGECYFTPTAGFQGNAYFNYTIADRPSGNATGKTDRATANIAIGNNIDLYFWDGTVDGNITDDPTFIDDDHFEAWIDGVPIGNGVGTNSTPLRIGLSLDPGWHTINFCFVEERPYEGQLGVLSYEIRDKFNNQILKSGYGLTTPTVDSEEDFPVCFDEFSNNYPRSFHVPDHN